MYKYRKGDWVYDMLDPMHPRLAEVLWCWPDTVLITHNGVCQHQLSHIFVISEDDAVSIAVISGTVEID